MYPETLLNKTVRRAIMIVLIAVFFILAPLLIFYTVGYRFDWETREVRQTGVISINIEPKDASFFLNDIEVKKKMPIRLTNMAPGRYRVMLQKAGYKSWRKDIQVLSKQTTYIKNIDLIKDSLPTNYPYSFSTSTAGFSNSNDGQFALALKNDGNLAVIELVNLRNENVREVSKLIDSVPTEIYWSPFKNYAALINRNSNSTIVRTFEAQNPDKQFSYTLPKTDKVIIPNWPKNKDGTEIYVNINEIAYKLEDGVSEKIGLAEEINRIVDLNGNRAIARQDEQITVINTEAEESSKKIEARDIVYNAHTKEWLAWSPWTLYTIYETGDVEELYRTGDSIKNVTALNKNGDLLLAHENKLVSFNPGYFVSHVIYSGPIEHAFADPEQKKVYFVGVVAGKKGFFELQL